MYIYTRIAAEEINPSSSYIYIYRERERESEGELSKCMQVPKGVLVVGSWVQNDA